MSESGGAGPSGTIDGLGGGLTKAKADKIIAENQRRNEKRRRELEAGDPRPSKFTKRSAPNDKEEEISIQARTALGGISTLTQFIREREEEIDTLRAKLDQTREDGSNELVAAQIRLDQVQSNSARLEEDKSCLERENTRLNRTLTDVRAVAEEKFNQIRPFWGMLKVLKQVFEMGRESVGKETSNDVFELPGEDEDEDYTVAEAAGPSNGTACVAAQDQHEITIHPVQRTESLELTTRQTRFNIRSPALHEMETPLHKTSVKRSWMARLTQSQRECIIEMHHDGYKVSALREKFYCSKSLVINILRQWRLSHEVVTQGPRLITQEPAVEHTPSPSQVDGFGVLMTPILQQWRRFNESVAQETIDKTWFDCEHPYTLPSV